jgi:hypothetical protein
MGMLLGCVASSGVGAEARRPASITPQPDVLQAAHRMVEDVFANLKAGKTDAIAKWMADQIGYTWDASTRIKNMNDYKSKLDIVVVSPPAGYYGKLDGYDLLQESYLPGTDRYFRSVYISYHEGAPLLWEFRVYVKPDGKVAVSAVSWSDKNPFEYLATSDMLLDLWISK